MGRYMVNYLLGKGGGGGGGGVNNCPKREFVDGVGCRCSCCSLSRRRSSNVTSEPYPGSNAQIRQDFRPSQTVNITEYWGAPWFGASSGLRVDWGLAALRVPQEGDSLLGTNRYLADSARTTVGRTGHYRWCVRSDSCGSRVPE